MKRYFYIFIALLLSITAWADQMPRVNLYFDVLETMHFNNGTMQVIEGEDTLSLPINVRHRGANARYYDKPSYAIKIVDSLGLKTDTALLGMRNDNYWILDAMAIDKARMRNRVSMDLWLEYSRKPWYYDQEPKLINGYRGKMVEVYVNDSAQGIYCLQERVDRKQLKLKKYSEEKGVRGILYKDTKVTLLGIYYIDSRNQNGDTTALWDGWEQEYPDTEDGDPLYWDPLRHHVVVCTRTYSSVRLADTISLHLDAPVYVDYVLLCQLLSARDNVSKNLFLSYYNYQADQRAVYTPWDLDHAWGRQYNSTEEATDAQLDFDQNYLYKRLKMYWHLEDSLKTRYAELRQHYFTIDHIDSLFAPYFDLYAQTGMDTVEQQIWSGHNDIEIDIPSEQQYIHDWVVERLVYLDTLYQYTAPEPPVPTNLQEEKNHSTGTVMRDGNLYIRRGEDYYDLLGRKLPSW